MADIESGYDLFTSSVGLEPDDADWPPPGEQDAWPTADAAVLPPGGHRADGNAARAAEQPIEAPEPVVPEWLDAGYLPRAAAGPVRRGSGFASGDVLDTALPGPALAEFADTAAGDARGYAGLNDDELIGVLGSWRKTEAWAAAGRLSAVAELIRRRPVEHSGGPGTADGPTLGPGTPPGPGDDQSGSGGSRDSASANGPASGGAGAAPGGIPVGWGKFCADELAVALAISRWPAEKMLALAHDLATRLPGTRRALHEGVIDAYKAQIIAEATRVLDDAAAAAAEATILATLAGKTPGQIRIAIARAVLQADPAAARIRREQAQKDARVELWREDAGTAAICGFGLPPNEALAADQRISDRAAELKTAGVTGTMDQLRVRAYLNALLGQDTAATTRNGSGTASQDAGAQPGPGGPAGPGAASAPGDATGPGASGQPAGTPAGAPGSSEDRAGTAAGGAGTAGGSQQAGRGAGQQRGMAAQINLTIPLVTLLGLAERPGEAGGFGPIDPDLARAMAAAAATDPATTWCLTVTDHNGHPTAHGCAHPARPTKPRRTAKPDRGPARPAPGPPQPTGPPGTPGGADSRPPSADSTGTSGGTGQGPHGGPGWDSGYGAWRLGAVPGGPDLTVDLEPIAVIDCDHRHHTAAHDPSDRLRHLVEIRDGECTYLPCRRAARRCDFEHAIPWEAGGWTCACNAGARCRHHHHLKQAPGWHVQQHLPGYHTWTTPSGRQYTTGPMSYPI